MTVLYEHTALRAGAFNVQHRFYRGKELFVSEPHHVNPDLRSNTNWNAIDKNYYNNTYIKYISRN